MAGILHGGGLTAAIAVYGGKPADWLDLSTGINPNTPSLPEIPIDVWNRLPDRALMKTAREAARNWYLGARPTPLSVLPDISPTRGESDPRHSRVQQSFATKFGGGDRAAAVPHLLSPLVGEMSGKTEGGRCLPLPVPGTQAFIQILPKLVPQDRPIAILSPTYGEYAHCFRKAGFEIDPIRSLDELKDEHGTLVIVNPNNPDGRTFQRDELLDLHARMYAQGGHLHVDEAFGDAKHELSLADAATTSERLTVSRSFGKFFGMAGIRLGFVFAKPETLEVIDAALGPWAVSGPALYLAKELMSRDPEPVLEAIRQRKRGLQNALDGAGLAIAGGTELFALVALDSAPKLFEHLARSHILVRKFDYEPRWLRIGLTPDEQGDKRLADTLALFRD